MAKFKPGDRVEYIGAGTPNVCKGEFAVVIGDCTCPIRQFVKLLHGPQDVMQFELMDGTHVCSITEYWRLIPGEGEVDGLADWEQIKQWLPFKEQVNA